MGSYSIDKPKIDASLGRKADGSPVDGDRVEIGPTELAFSEWRRQDLRPPNLLRLREYRFGRVVEYLQKHDYGGILLFDPLNIRYATDSSNMQIWTMHNFTRACFVGVDGHCVLWDFHNCEHLSAHLPLVREVRMGASFFYFECGDRISEKAGLFAAEVFDLLGRSGGVGNRRLAVDKIEVGGVLALQALGVEIFDGQELMEHARSVKGEEELCALRCAIFSCEAAMDEMRQVFVPGISEAELWGHLHLGNIKRGGEWIETRLLSSGARTNPWFQECGPRLVQAGDLLAFDTDLVGVYGYCCDISRTWLCGDAWPDDAQKRLYQVAYEHIHSNRELLKAGLGFAELTQTALPLPQAYRALRYGVLAHGVGLCDEYPCIRYPEDFVDSGYDGVLEAGMVICVEAYVGEVGGKEGVKLEEQVVITEDGCEVLSHYPYEDAFLR